MMLARRFGGVAVLAASVLYYAFYFNSSYAYTDDGSYAQICYEMLLGRAPQELSLGYGLLWFKTGETLFALFGVNFTLIKVLFFSCITLTNVLVYYTVLRASRDWRLAGAATLVTLLVPNFPATAFYGLAVMLSAAAQMRLASRDSEASPLDAVLAGAALAVSFQLRPDFGYVFTVSLVALLVLAARTRPRQAAGLLVVALGTLVVASLPLFLAATIGGYVDLLVQQYLYYPPVMVEQLINGLKGLAGITAGGVATPGTGLARPPIAWMVSGDIAKSGAALLVYLPLISIAAFGLFTLATLPRRWTEGRLAAVGEAGIGLTAAVAAFPHYFFYRPDLPHVANFMPGYVVMAAVFVAQVFRERGAPPAHWRTVAATAVAVLLTAHLGLYLRVGLPSQITGSIGIAAGRTEPFKAANGVDVRVSVAEKELLEGVRDAVERNSQPGDAIVCVPYCPGMAFMTARRMFFGNFYVDDGFLSYDPEWLPTAIARTRAERPPVVIVADWAINETEQSRFTIWAASYVDAVKEISRATVALPGGFTVYVLEPAP